jgi:hypothetical protein
VCVKRCRLGSSIYRDVGMSDCRQCNLGMNDCIGA